MTTTKRLTTRGHATAEAIRDRVDFITSGALSANAPSSPLGPWARTGDLWGRDLDQFKADVPLIDYVVYSYATPIAWHLSTGEWYRVCQSFSITTSKHQGNLYLIDTAKHASTLTPITGERGHWRVECDTCGTVIALVKGKDAARQRCFEHHINGVHWDGTRHSSSVSA